MKIWFRRLSALLLAMTILLGIVPQIALIGEAADVTVKIVGFMDGSETNLRAAQLLHAKVEGYEGNTAYLTYKWTNNLGKRVYGWWGRYTDYGTYLYVYNTHNMYYAQGTDGEQEIHNTARGVTPLSNMPGRSHDQTFTGVGYAYAAVYDADRTPSYYNEGSIKVEVYDGDIKIPCQAIEKRQYYDEAWGAGWKAGELLFLAELPALGIKTFTVRAIKEEIQDTALVQANVIDDTVTDEEMAAAVEELNFKEEV